MALDCCYEIFYQDKLIGRDWARAKPDPESGHLHIECYQDSLAHPDLGIPAARKKSHYIFDQDGRPVQATLIPENADGFFFEFTPDKITLNGAPFKNKGAFDFISEASAPSLLIQWWRYFHQFSDLSFTTLSLPSGAVLPIDLKRDGFLVHSNLGQVFERDAHGQIIKISTPDKPDIVLVRADHRVPDWHFKDQKNTLSYECPNDLVQKEIALSLKDEMYEATLCTPKTGEITACALFISGTGTYDRHGLKGKTDLGYHEICDGLARLGIATLRFEKFRGDHNNACHENVEPPFETQCAHADIWLNWMAQQSGLKDKPRLIIGHSLGGLIALALEKSHDDLSACLLLAAPGRPLKEIIADQITWHHDQSGLSETARSSHQILQHKLYDALQLEGDWINHDVDPRLLPHQSLRPFLKSTLDLDPVNVMAPSGRRLLLVQGENDHQVRQHDFHRLINAASKKGRAVQSHFAPGLDQLLKPNAKTGYAHFQAYQDQNRKIPQELIVKLHRMITETLKHP